METNKELVEQLNSLCQYDIDTVYAYEQAIENVEDNDVRDRLTQFCEDHERHVLELSNVIYGYGGTPPQPDPDLKGFLLEGYSFLRSITGTIGALKAMRMSEVITNRVYQDMLDVDMGFDLRQLIENNREDERRHLNYIEVKLEEFEEATRRPSPTGQPTVHP